MSKDLPFTQLTAFQIVVPVGNDEFVVIVDFQLVTSAPRGI